MSPTVVTVWSFQLGCTLVSAHATNKHVPSCETRRGPGQRARAERRGDPGPGFGARYAGRGRGLWPPATRPALRDGQGREEKEEGVQKPGRRRRRGAAPEHGCGVGQGLAREPQYVGLRAGVLCRRACARGPARQGRRAVRVPMRAGRRRARADGAKGAWGVGRGAFV